MMIFPEYKKRPIDSLIPYARNSRTHTAEQVLKIAASIREFGFINPVITDGAGGIIAGHGRVLAAKQLGMTELPCIDAKHLTAVQRRAYVLADNKLALDADWDDTILRAELNDLIADGFDITLTGFSLDAVAVPMEGLTDEDAVPEIPAEPVSVLGDVWLLGTHRVMCGDSTSIDAVEKLMDGQKADMVFTDPPYGMSYGGGRAKGDHQVATGGRSIKAHGEILGDSLQGGDLRQMVADSIGNAATSAKDGASAYICFTWRTYTEFHTALAGIGLEPKACIVWDKQSIGLGHGNYRPRHEFIFYCTGQWYGDKAQSDVWHMSRGATGKYVHPTQKPVELVEKAMGNSSKAGDAVHDCFGGSGSTLIACEKNHRRAYLMELDPQYVDVIVKRWQDFTGLQAMHADTGALFDVT